MRTPQSQRGGDRRDPLQAKAPLSPLFVAGKRRRLPGRQTTPLAGTGRVEGRTPPLGRAPSAGGGGGRGRGSGAYGKRAEGAGVGGARTPGARDRGVTFTLLDRGTPPCSEADASRARERAEAATEGGTQGGGPTDGGGGRSPAERNKSETPESRASAVPRELLRFFGGGGESPEDDDDRRTGAAGSAETPETGCSELQGGVGTPTVTGGAALSPEGGSEPVRTQLHSTPACPCAVGQPAAC